jgi:peptidoglycan/LPS O-acetylase OafA/YrhL
MKPGAQSPFVAGRIPSLDGLRALSIGMVLFAHVSGTRFFPSFVAIRRDLGNLGVRIFFVISGFLITTLLLEEFEKTGRISLKLFYLRRGFRIFPCAYTYVGIAALLTLGGWLSLSTSHLIHAATYTVNYDPIRPWHLIHLWSLSVEEQFYFIWPVVLCLLGARRSLWFAASVLLLAPLTRIGMWYLTPSLRWSIGTAFQTNADALAAGCVLAGIWSWLSCKASYLTFLESRRFLFVPAVGILACTLLSREEIPLMLLSYGFGLTVLNISIALCIDRCVRSYIGTIGRFLNWKPVAFVGVLSYSIYLWQEPFLNRLGTSTINWFPINMILVAAVALASYYLVEKPFLTFRRKIERSLIRSAQAKADQPRSLVEIREGCGIPPY